MRSFFFLNSLNDSKCKIILIYLILDFAEVPQFIFYLKQASLTSPTLSQSSFDWLSLINRPE